MINVEHVIQQVRHNCDVSDAGFSGIFSVCGLALRLRDLFKWEHDLNPWVERDSVEVLEWIGKKEDLWDSVTDKGYADIVIADKSYDPFSTQEINGILEPEGMFYGAGYAYGLKPTFFLASLKSKSRTDGFTVVVLERELARDLATLPAVSQDDHIIIREASGKVFLWDQMMYLNKSGRPYLHFALARLGIEKPDSCLPKEHLDVVYQTFKNVLIRHEIGELSDTAFDRARFQTIVSEYPHTVVELLARTLKDLLADTAPNGTLNYLVQTKDAAGLGLYAAFINHLMKALSPRLHDAVTAFMENGSWQLIETATAATRKQALEIKKQLLDICDEGERRNDKDWTQKAVTCRIIDPVQNGKLDVTVHRVETFKKSVR